MLSVSKPWAWRSILNGLLIALMVVGPQANLAWPASSHHAQREALNAHALRFTSEQASLMQGAEERLRFEKDALVPSSSFRLPRLSANLSSREAHKRIAQLEKLIGRLSPLSVSASPVSAQPAASDKAPFTEAEFEALSKMIETPIEQFDLNLFKKIYKTPHAPDMLKLIMGRPENAEKNRKLGNLRKWYDWTIQAEYARDNHIAIENTNQGKDNGARSDLDATANILEFDKSSGQFVIREKAVGELIKYQAGRYSADGLTPDGVDVTLFNGDTWLPDWRDSRMSYSEFQRRLISNTWDLKNRKGAYFVPGAHKEQAHDRALAEGHSVQIGWDYVKKVPVINGRPVEFDSQRGEIVDAETKQPIQEYNTREAAAKGIVRRYANVEVLEARDSWRRALGNVIQNVKEFLTHDEPLSRNKYFIERAVDQGAGRFVDFNNLSFVEAIGPTTHLSQNTYVAIHGSDLEAGKKNAWKKAFIQQAFGIPESEGQRITEIQSVLDRSSEIQLDKTKKWSDGHGADYVKRRSEYYGPELSEADRNVRNKLQAAGKQPGSDFEELKLKEAERLFVEKQRSISIEGGVRVVEESFRRVFSQDGIRASRDRFGAENTKKIMFEQGGVELALLLDLIETSPGIKAAQRDALRERITKAIPESAKPLVAKLAEIAGLKMKLVGRAGLEGYTKSADGLSDIRPTELIAQVEEEMKRVLGDVDSQPSVAPETVRRAIFELIHENLGPTQKAEFEKAWEAGKRAMIARFGASAYWNEIKNQMDFLMVTGAALGMINAYQQHCLNQSSSLSEACVSGLAFEAGHQTLYALPGINTGLLVLTGLKTINEGNPEGFITLGLGTASLPSVSRLLGGGAVGIKIFIAYQILKLGYAVTVGYAVQAMENDALEQAFKANPEGGKQARRYNYPNQPWNINRADTPTTPLLSDAIQVEADGWDAQKRYKVAKEKFAPAIQDELKELGLKPETDEWYAKRSEIIGRHADLLPYTQRMEQLYKFFSPRVEQLIAQLRSNGKPDAAEDLIGMKTCLEVREAKVEEKYKAPPSLWNQLRFWRDDQKDKQQELNQVWSQCLQSTVQNEDWIKAVFNKYLDGWFARQSDGYRSSYDTLDMRQKLSNALLSEYVVRRHLDLGYENERQMQKAAKVAKDQADMRVKLMGHLLQKQNENQTQAQTTIQRAVERTYQGEPPTEAAAKPEIKITAPSFAVRLGQDAPFDVAARGQYYNESKPEGKQQNQWKTVVQSEITGITLDRPSNLVSTKALEEEVTKTSSGQPRKFITIDEKLTGELQDGRGQKLATAEAATRYYDLLPPWGGGITVEVRAEGENTKDKSDPKRGYAYGGALVKISGAAQAQKESEYSSTGDWAGAGFDKLPAGNFSIHVEPKPGDKTHTAVDATINLLDFTPAFGLAPQEGEQLDGRAFTIKRFEKDQAGNSVARDLILVRWKDYDTVTVYLPYVPPETKAEEKPTTQNQNQNQNNQNNQNSSTGNQTNNQNNQPNNPTSNQPDPQKVKECNDLVAAAQQQMANDPAAASRALEQAKQKCAGLTPGIDSAITNAGQQIDQAIQQAINEAQVNIGKCEYEAALRVAQQLEQLNPNLPWLRTNLPQLQQQADAQRQARQFLRPGLEAIQRKDLDGAIGSLRQALGVPGVPPCLRDQITKLLRELEAHKRFIGMTEQVEQATTKCDYKEAARIVGEINKINPREQYVSDWLTKNLPTLADLQDREKKAITLINRAEALANEANALSSTDPADWTVIGSKIAEAMQALTDADKIAPKCLRERQKMDPLRQLLADIQRRKKAQIATSIVLLIDTSGSMNESNKMNQAKDAAKRAARNASKTTEIAVLNFDGGCDAGAVRVAASFTTDVNALVAAIDGLRPGGGTPMYIATGVAVDFAQKRGQGQQRTVILMSDGGDSCRDKQAQAAAAIRSSNIPVSTIGFDVGNNQQAQDDMRNLATITGGRTFAASAADPREIIKAFNLALLPSLLKDFDFGSGGGGAVQGFFSQAKMMVQQQNLNGALSQLQQAQQLAPNSPSVNFNLSLLHEAQDQLIPAMNFANNYLKLAPNAIDRGDVETRIANLQEELRKNPRTMYDPSSCRDVLAWAQAEQDVAKATKDVPRRQAVLEVLIAAQKGDCENARKLQANYKQRYR